MAARTHPPFAGVGGSRLAKYRNPIPRYHERLLGRAWLALLYRFEELAPHWFAVTDESR
jgi:hypothetical protein